MCVSHQMFAGYLSFGAITLTLLVKWSPVCWIFTIQKQASCAKCTKWGSSKGDGLWLWLLVLVTCDRCQVSCSTWHNKPNTGHMTYASRHMTHGLFSNASTRTHQEKKNIWFFPVSIIFSDCFSFSFSVPLCLNFCFVSVHLIIYCNFYSLTSFLPFSSLKL